MSSWRLTICAALLASSGAAAAQVPPSDTAGVAATVSSDRAASPAPEPEPIGTAEDALAAARAVYGPVAPEPEIALECERLQRENTDEIVVCAPLEDQARFRVPSSSDEGDLSQLAWDGAAPNVEGPGIFQGPATVGGLCGIGLNPCPPPPAYIFDIAALPEPPAGSDADRIARGEADAP